jgi:hypothetical protein
MGLCDVNGSRIDLHHPETEEENRERLQGGDDDQYSHEQHAPRV